MIVLTSIADRPSGRRSCLLHARQRSMSESVKLTQIVSDKQHIQKVAATLHSVCLLKCHYDRPHQLVTKTKNENLI